MFCSLFNKNSDISRNVYNAFVTSLVKSVIYRYKNGNKSILSNIVEMKRACLVITQKEMIKVRVTYDTIENKQF